MDIFYINILMFFGSSIGLSFIYSLILTFYLISKTGKYIDFLWILFPIVPLIHFFSTKKTKKTWIIFIIMMMFYIFFVTNLEPGITDQKISRVVFNYANKQYIITQNEQPKLTTRIKWEIYKIELLSNLGVETNKGHYLGELKIYVCEAIISKYNFPMNNILAIVEKTQI